MPDPVFIGRCPVPKCERRNFEASSYKELLDKIRDHIKVNLEDPNHSDIAEMEGWLDPVPDPLGD